MSDPITMGPSELQAYANGRAEAKLRAEIEAFRGAKVA